jgi:excinuclease ABC subunit B
MFQIKSDFPPAGDQPQAIEKLTQGLLGGVQSQVLLGVTGSGKTYTMANVIANVGMPTLILAHNKTLAAQLFQEFQEFFPNNAVEYFVSYYDYYQPEAYIARTDTYIEKDMAINDQIDKLRLSATRSLLERDDVIIVASVSCIYGLGMPEYYAKMHLRFEIGQQFRRDDLLLHLVEMAYKRNDVDFFRGVFRSRGDLLEIFPAYEEEVAVRIEFFDEEVEKISLFDPLTGKVLERLDRYALYPASHHVTPEEVRHKAIKTIKQELEEREAYFEKENKLVEAQRLRQRTVADIEMMRETGTCKGIENYSRHFSGRNPGDPPPCLLDYLPERYLLIVDESHVTVPQLHAMYNGDRARKRALVDFGFRLPSAYDNRPLKFTEVYRRISQVVYVSATPAEFEIQEASGQVVQQIIRPTGLLDPKIDVRPASGQVDDVLEEIRQATEKGGRVLVTTLTKRLAEELTGFLHDLNIRAKYLHSEITTLERVQIIRELRMGQFDVLVGINLLREGLDIPEVTMVAILDADKEGFLRSETSLIQTCGRAARNSEGRVVLYADRETESIRKTLEVTDRRRHLQERYNQEHGITPRTVRRDISQALAIEVEEEIAEMRGEEEILTPQEVAARAAEFEQKMKRAAKERRFEDAAHYRDEWRKYEQMLLTFC